MGMYLLEDSPPMGERHYDRGSDLFEAMLDSRMNCSGGFWQKADSLENAQTDKLDLKTGGPTGLDATGTDWLSTLPGTTLAR